MHYLSDPTNPDPNGRKVYVEVLERKIMSEAGAFIEHCRVRDPGKFTLGSWIPSYCVHKD